jgi:hypothetical protein
VCVTYHILLIINEEIRKSKKREDSEIRNMFSWRAKLDEIGHPPYFGMRLPIHSLRGWMWPSPSNFLFGKVDEVDSIRCVIGFSIIIFLQGFFVYSPPPVYVYIRASGPHMNTSVIPNMVYKAKN